MPGVNTKLAFMLGYSVTAGDQEKLRNESIEFGDIVQGNFVDSYKNLTYKTVMGHLWVSKFCTQAKFVIKADDDIYVDLYAAYTVAQRYIKDQVMIIRQHSHY